MTTVELEELRALILLMRDNGVSELIFPGGVSVKMGASPASKPRVAAAPSKPVEPLTEKQIAEEEEAMLFAHLG
jgi:hypothetical protein